ncbi:MAG: transglutaminase domain-containing protein [Candidatus Obscuribacter sp.]|nr:transglutaminase domain-containing protein [Candidatus Obscuribacter sp.]
MSQAELEPPEDSIPLRLIVFGMTMTCIAASCIFVPTHWGVIVLTVALALIGSLVSYQYRHQNQKWSQWIVLAGMLGVGANALNEFVHPMNSVTDFWGPVVHFIAGTFALHSFDLKARSNINLSAMLGALILCALSPVARSIYFGGIVFGYICLGSLMLYFDCLSRTQHNWLKKPMQIAPVSLSGGERHRTASGSTNLTMGLLPLAALIVFLAVPRSDNLLDIILSSLKTLNPAALLQLLPRFVPEMAPQPKKNPYNPDLLKKLKEPKALKDKPKDVKKDKAKEEKKPLKDKKKDKKEDPKKDPKKDSVKKPEPKALTEKEKKEAEAKAKKKEQQKKAKAAKKGGKPKAPAKKHAKPKPMTAADAKQLIDKEFGEIFPEKLNVERKHNHLLSQVILFRVTSTRLFYPRLSVFDTFDGDTWTRSKDDMPAKVVEIKSGGGPNDKPVLRDGIERDQNGKPIHELSAEQEADLEVARDSFFKEADTESGFGATEAVHYIFSKSDKSTYDVGKAQSFRVPRKVPYIDLTQSYDLLVDIGKDVPSCWIPRSLGFDGSTALVDDYGTISFPEKLKKGTNYKVTSSWPVNDLNSMRDANPLSADDELQLRNKLANYLQLPEGIDEEVKAFGDKAIGGTGNWFEQAEKLCHAVRENSTFTDEDLPPETPATPAGAPATAPAASTNSGAAPVDPSESEGAAPATATPAAAPAATTDKGTAAPVPPAPPATTGPAASGSAADTSSPEPTATTDTAATTGSPADEAKPAESAEQAKAAGADASPADAATSDDGEDKSPASAKNSELGDKVYDFLFGRRLGDSRRFATAFAVLCRQQGLPCRIVVGFNPGTFNKLNGTHEIYGSDTHTWVEVYIPDYGWVAFDATPDGSFPEQKRDEGYGFAQALKALQEALGITDGQITPKTLLTIGAILLALLFLIAGIIYGIIVLRRCLKKRREGQNWSGQEWKVYQACSKTSKIKIVREPTESQKQFVERVSSITKDRIRQGGTMAEELPVALANFFSVYEAIHFGDAESVDFKSGIPDLRDKASKVSALARASKPGAAEKAVKSKKGDAASAVKERGKPTAADSAVRRGPRP